VSGTGWYILQRGVIWSDCPTKSIIRGGKGQQSLRVEGLRIGERRVKDDWKTDPESENEERDRDVQLKREKIKTGGGNLSFSHPQKGEGLKNGRRQGRGSIGLV